MQQQRDKEEARDHFERVRDHVSELQLRKFKVDCRSCSGKGWMTNYGGSRSAMPAEETRCGQCGGWGYVWRMLEDAPVPG